MRRVSKAQGIIYLILIFVSLIVFAAYWIYQNIILVLYDFAVNLYLSVIKQIIQTPLIQIVLIVSLIMLVVYITIGIHIRIKISDKDKSILQLKEINRITSFHNLPEIVEKKYFYDNKRSLDSTDPKIVLYNSIFDGVNPFKNELIKSFENSSKLEQYRSEIMALRTELDQNSENSSKIFRKRYNKIRKKFFNELIIEQPITNPKFVIKLEYTSPQGRNTWTKTATFYKNEFEPMIQEIEKDKARQFSRINEKLIERRKLNDSLRFKILKRYDYKCQICGRNAAGGAVLHVDHKIPIAKGGKTIESNLWVLCDRCNLGKGTKSL